LTVFSLKPVSEELSKALEFSKELKAFMLFSNLLQGPSLSNDSKVKEHYFLF